MQKVQQMLFKALSRLSVGVFEEPICGAVNDYGAIKRGDYKRLSDG